MESFPKDEMITLKGIQDWALASEMTAPLFEPFWKTFLEEVEEEAKTS